MKFYVFINIKSNNINKPDINVRDEQENYNDLKNCLLASMPIISVTSPKTKINSSRSPLRKNFVKSSSKSKHPIIKIEEDILSNSFEENNYSKRNTSQRNLKSANPNFNNNYAPGNLLMNQSIKNSTINSSNLNSTQQGSLVIFLIKLFFNFNIIGQYKKE